MNLCELKETQFRNCDLTGCIFSGSDLRSSRFDTCSHENSDFSYCDLRGVSFGSNDYGGINLIGAKVNNNFLDMFRDT